MHDIGRRAVTRGTGSAMQRGFRVTVGGGTSIMCKSGHLLYDFLPAGEMLNVAEAIVRVFHRYGDYTHKQANRMKFLMKSLAWERWHAAFQQALDQFSAEGGAGVPFDPERPSVEEAPAWSHAEAPSMLQTMSRATASNVIGPGILPEVRPVLPMMNGDYVHWVSTNVRPQKQADYCMVTATIPLGDVTSAQMHVLADLALAYADGVVRVTSEQDLLFRWVRTRDVPDLYRRLSTTGLGLPDANTVVDVASCPGAESCKLAVTQSRGLGTYLGDHLRARPDLVASAPDLTVKISGCPNGCGRHHVAGIGFQGSVRKVGTKAVPQYFILVGGGLTHDGAQFGRLAAKVPVRRLREAFERLIELYRTDRHDGETATAFFMRVDVARVKEVLADLERLTPEDALPEDFVDLAEDVEFNPEIQEGECSA
jgi:sulfite reductase (NADPH) hemoprotein beta-component